MTEQILPRTDPADNLLSAYHVPDGVADELLDTTGQMRPVWAPFVEELSKLSPDDVAKRFARGDQYLRDAGVFFRQYGNDTTSERDWPLSHIPVLLHENEWAQISAGLIQRAEILEQVVSDLYGSQRLVRDGWLPAELIAQNPEWLRPMVGVRPTSGHFLHFIAFEIGRSPDGSWFVLGDRTQAPSGAGFALENRMATTRVFAEPFPKTNVHRLAPFFRGFRQAMDRQRGGMRERTAILTPGPNNDTYFEHVYIARYLGLMLLEGEDLTVENGEVMVRTVAGLKPVSVLWRRMDARFADALELDETSQIGTPGLLSALRDGKLSMVNALGVGVLQTRALLAFLPNIAEALTGSPLQLPNIATWWCGHGNEREYVKANTRKMMIGHAYSVDLPFEIDATTALGGKFRGSAQGSIDDWIDAEAGRLVGQEAVSLSTTPAYHDGRLVPRPMTVRVFAARTPAGWTIMPGGYARIGRTEDATALAMQRGGSVADVWIVSDRPVDGDTMVTDAAVPYRRPPPSILPSRAADNLLWLGRYVERTEGLFRLLRAYHLRLAETGNPSDPRLTMLADYLGGLDIEVSDTVPPAVLSALQASTACASKVRDRFSFDGWQALQDLAGTAEHMARTVNPGDDAARSMGVLLRKITGFSGLVHENMYHFTGWRFLSLGRALERADGISGVLASFADPRSPEGSFDIAVEVGDSVMTHQRRYKIETNRNTVVDLLALDANNPRAILFQVSVMRDLITRLPGEDSHGPMSPLMRHVRRLETELATAMPEEVDAQYLWAVKSKLAKIYDLTARAYLR